MRENTKKLLLFLYPVKGEAVWLRFSQLHELVPELTKAGLQSALFLLDKKELLRIDRSETEWRYSLSSYGVRLLESIFPALLQSHEQSSEWLLIVFLTAPKTDQNFRYLRNFLVQNQGVALTRAVYLVPKQVVSKVTEVLQSSYKNAALLLQVNDWLFGDDYKIIGQRAGLYDLFELYSSISREVDRLIDVKILKKSFTQQEKVSYFSALNRFLGTLESDHSLLRRYYPDVESAAELLSKFQKAIKL
jgi:DNA-binding transcriptional regulator PaaX